MNKKQVLVDGYKPISNTIYQYYGCKWHGCTCLKDRSEADIKNYENTLKIEEVILQQGYNLISVCECSNPSKLNIHFEKVFTPYPYYIVFDFEAILKLLGDQQTTDLTYLNEHIPVSVAIYDSFSNKAVYLEDKDPESLIARFVKTLEEKQEAIVKAMIQEYSYPSDFEMLPERVQTNWKQWIEQVPVFGFNSGKYDLNMIKKYFVKAMGNRANNDIFVGKKENTYMFLTTPKFKFLDIKNYLAPGVSLDQWFKAYKCKLKKLVFPYEWLDDYRKLTHKGPIDYECFYSSLANGIKISKSEYKDFVSEFYKRGCVTMGDWLREYNIADVEPFVEALDKTRKQYYPDKIDISKDVVGIPGLSMTYVLNKAIKKDRTLKLYAPGNNAVYELLKTGMIGGPSIVFCRYHEKNITNIRSHLYTNPKPCQKIIGYDANSLYLYCMGQDMPCGKEELIMYEEPYDIEHINQFNQAVKNSELFGFAQVDIKVPDKLYDKFSEMSPLFVTDGVGDKQIPKYMEDYKEKTGRKTIKNSRKLLGVMKAKKILLYTPLIEWYLKHGLEITAVHQFISYTSEKPFAWFPDEVAEARRNGDVDPSKQILSDTAKLKGNTPYGKLIENLLNRITTTFTTNTDRVDMALRSPHFQNLEEINDVYEVKERKKQVKIKRPYQCGIAVYQLAKLRMFEFYYDFIDKYIDRGDFELCYMDTDSYYMGLSSDKIDDIVKTGLKTMYNSDKQNWVVTDDYSKRTPGLFKPEFIGVRGVFNSSKCYIVQNDECKNKYSCKGVSKKQNDMTFQRYKDNLEVSIQLGLNPELENITVDKVKNTGFRMHDQRIITYEQVKLGLSAYYDKRYVLSDGIHTRLLD